MKLFLAALAVTASFAAHAQVSWPSRPLHIIVPAGAGSVADVRARWLANRLAPDIGQPVIVENHPGAGGSIGTELGVRSPPDGYTLIVIHQGTMVVNPHLYAKLAYDPLRDLVPLTRLGYGPLMLAVNPALPVHSVSDLVALARTRRLSYGTGGIGTPPHLAVELFLRAAHIQATHVPYRGGGQAVADLIGGTTDFEIEGLTVLLPHVKAGRLRAIAITGDERSSACPDIPTVREQGLPRYDYFGWVGLALPAGTPAPIVERVHDAIARELRTAAARDWFGRFAADPTPDTPQRFARLIRREYERMGPVIRAAGIKTQ